MLFCLGCCDRCTICHDRFERADSDDIASGAPLGCPWSAAGPVSLVDGRLRIGDSGAVSGPSGQRVEVLVRANDTSDVVEIALGDVVGTAIFGAPGYLVLSGGQRDSVSVSCNLPPATDLRLVLCLGYSDEEQTQPAAKFLLADNSCAASDDLWQPLTDRGVSLRSRRGTLEFEEVSIQRPRDDQRPECPECAPAPTPDCLVCHDQFQRPDAANVATGAPCNWTDEGDAEIVSQHLRLPAGSSVSGPSGDYVVVIATGTAPGSQLAITLGDVVGTVTFGQNNGEGQLKLACIEGVFTRAGNILAGHQYVFVLCVGNSGRRWGVTFQCSSLGPEMQASGLLGSAEPASPYGQVSLSAAGSTVVVSSVSIRLRKTDSQSQCVTCTPHVCQICEDYSLSDFSATDCRLLRLTGFGVPGSPGTDNWATSSNAIARLGAGNPEGRSVMYAVATWSWDLAGPGDAVRLFVAADASVSNALFIEVTNGGYGQGYEGAGCTRLYRRQGGSNQLISTVPNWSPGFAALAFDGENVWISGTLITADQLLGGDREPVGGPYAAIGTGHLDEGHYIRFDSVELSWYAALPYHTRCLSGVQYCPIFAVGFPNVGILGSTSAAGDPAVAINCNVQIVSGTWTADFLNGGWITQSTAARVDVVTNHPHHGPSLNGYVSWAYSVGVVDPVEDYSNYAGLAVEFLHGGQTIRSEFLGAALGTSQFVSFNEVTLLGQSGITARYGAGVNPLGDFLGVCFSAGRTQLVYGLLGFRSVVGCAPGDGTTTGIRSGSAYYGVGAGGASLAVRQIALERNRDTAAQNLFTGIPPASCIDCAFNRCLPCDADTPQYLNVSIAPKAGADLSNVCGFDVAALTGAFTLQSHLGGCHYSIYLGPTSRAAVAQYTQYINNYVNTDGCRNVLAVLADMAQTVTGVRFQVKLISVTADPLVSYDQSWVGEIPFGQFHCQSFSKLLVGDGPGPTELFSDLFDVTVEYP